MRYDKPIYFQVRTKGAYNPATGNYAPAEPIESPVHYASIMDTQDETKKLVYGEIREGSLTIHIQTHYNSPFDCIRVGEGESAKIYVVDYRRRLREKDTFIVSEVM